MRIALIQQQAGSIMEMEQTLQKIIHLAREAGEQDAQFTIFPECAFPAYFLGLDLKAVDAALKQTLILLSELESIACEYRMYIAIGVIRQQNNKLFNSGVIIDPQGKQIAMVDKSNMWHFDTRWFEAGEEYITFNTPFGKMGFMICADARIPEITRILALEGAGIIIDLTNLGAQALKKDQLTNQQFQFVLPSRARENGVWILAADKVGLEGKSASYLGRSMVVSPEGEIVRFASTDQEEVLYYELPEITGCPRGSLELRRPEMYSLMTTKREEVPLYADLHKEINVEASEVLTAPVIFFADTLESYIEKTRETFFECAYLGTRLVFLPQCPGNVQQAADQIQRSIPEGTVVVLPGMDEALVKTALALTQNEVLGEWSKTHGMNSAEKMQPLHTLETPVGKIAIMFDEEAFIPEIARVYMLQGCNILLWSDSEKRNMNTKILQTRAAENRIFAVRNSTASSDCGCIADIDGRIIASSFEGEEQIPFGMIISTLSLSKSVLPGTHILNGRRENSYGRLISVPG